jgi:NADPH:quinone reductase-like Zn-dependent oxidoreductase
VRTRAILIDRLGPPERLVEREVELADPGPGQIHVEVHAAGVNFADLIMRMGLYGTVPSRPFSPGFEVAGTVARVGPNVDSVREGDRVIAWPRFGGYAHDVVVEANHVHPLPDEMNWTDAAAIPVVFATAWVCLFGVGRAAAGETVLVLGAGGGVGTAAVQLARAAGLVVYGTAGTEAKRDFVVQLGASECFDSRGDWETPLAATLGERGLDIALDPVGGAANTACRRQLGPLGRLVVYGMSSAVPGNRRNWFTAARAWLRTPRIHPMSLVRGNLSVSGVHLLHLSRKQELVQRAFQEMLPRFQSGELRPVLDRVFSFDRDGAVQAHKRLHARENLGKVVLARAGFTEISS